MQANLVGKPSPPRSSFQIIKTRSLVHYLDGHHIIRHGHDPLTSGGFCDIFTGDHPIHGKVAMKRPRMTEKGYTSSDMTNFLMESTIWKKLRHPNILQFIGLIQSDGHIWAISSFAENGSLPEYLKQNPLTDRRALVLQLADATGYLHRQGVVHGDIKGSNILISAVDTVLLCDFGLSKLSGTSTSSSLSGAASVRWCVPEILFEEAPKTFASDAYSFGMTVYEILSGSVPLYDIANEVLAIKAINDGIRPTREPAQSESGYPYEQLWDIASECWEGNPANRPSMEVICERLAVPITSFCGPTTEQMSIIEQHGPASSSASVAEDAGHAFGRQRTGHLTNLDWEMSQPHHPLDTGLSEMPLNGLKATIKALKERHDRPDDIGIKKCAALLIAILDTAQSVHGNDEEMRSLDLRFVALRRRIVDPLELVTNAPAILRINLTDRVTILEQELKDLKVELLILRRNGFVGKMTDEAANKEILKILKVHLDWITDVCPLEDITMKTTNKGQIHRNSNNLDNRAPDDFRAVQASSSQIPSITEDAAIRELPRAKARYDSSLRRGTRRCLEGTRVDLLETIHQWIDGTGPLNQPIFCLSGEAGTGKSTIAHTVAEDRDRIHQLGASFFFSRNEEARRDANLFISTLAYQLSVFDQGFKAHLAISLKNDPFLPERNIKIQLKQMVMEPLKRTRTLTTETIVVVVDALDECSPDGGAEEILEAWAEHIQDFPLRLLLFITSRPHPHIQVKFSTLQHPSTVFYLHDICRTVVKSDIKRYLRVSLADVLDGGLEGDDLELLSRHIGPLFVLASTYAKYIKDPSRADPLGQLRALLFRKATLGLSPEAELDTLYLDIVRCIPQGSNTQPITDAFREVVGAMVVAGIPMTPVQLSNFLGMEKADVLYILRRLSSVVFLPDDSAPVSFFHQSFSEFLTNSKRCTDPLCTIDKSGMHMRMAILCLDTFDTYLQENLPTFIIPNQTYAEFGDKPDIEPHSESGNKFDGGNGTQAVITLESEIPEALSLTTSKRYPDELCYACVYFAYHLNGIGYDAQEGNGELLKRFEQFYEEKLWQWLEVIYSLHDTPGIDDLPLRLHNGLIKFYQPMLSGRLTKTMLCIQQSLKPAPAQSFSFINTAGNSTPSDILCRCSRNITKLRRHWEWTCPDNPKRRASKHKCVERCGREYVRLDTLLRHQKRCPFTRSSL